MVVRVSEAELIRMTRTAIAMTRTVYLSLPVRLTSAF